MYDAIISLLQSYEHTGALYTLQLIIYQTRVNIVHTQHSLRLSSLIFIWLLQHKILHPKTDQKANNASAKFIRCAAGLLSFSSSIAAATSHPKN